MQFLGCGLQWGIAMVFLLHMATPPTSKVLAFVGARDVSCIRNPKHMYSEGENEERIMTSVHLSDFDPGTQKLVREIFGETRDPEYIEQ
jgi:hypothetical protein